MASSAGELCEKGPPLSQEAGPEKRLLQVHWLTSKAGLSTTKLASALLVCKTQEIEEVGDLCELLRDGKLADQGFKDVTVGKITKALLYKQMGHISKFRILTVRNSVVCTGVLLRQVYFTSQSFYHDFTA